MLVQLALKLEYPPMLMYLGIIVHSSPRVLEVESMLSKVIPAALLRDVLHRAHHRLPHVPVQSYVDDIAQFALGTSTYIMSEVPSAVLQFFRDVTACGCKVPTKSGVVASSASLQRAVVDEFKRMDIPVRASEAMKDLGVMSTAGRRKCAWK
eukprot:5987481-Pyramimonas_sp.AAC.1